MPAKYTGSSVAPAALPLNSPSYWGSTIDHKQYITHFIHIAYFIHIAHFVHTAHFIHFANFTYIASNTLHIHIASHSTYTFHTSILWITNCVRFAIFEKSTRRDVVTLGIVFSRPSLTGLRHSEHLPHVSNVFILRIVRTPQILPLQTLPPLFLREERFVSSVISPRASNTWGPCQLYLQDYPGHTQVQVFIVESCLYGLISSTFYTVWLKYNIVTVVTFWLHCTKHYYEIFLSCKVHQNVTIATRWNGCFSDLPVDT